MINEVGRQNQEVSAGNSERLWSFLEDILEKKVNKIALGIFETIIDFFASFFDVYRQREAALASRVSKVKVGSSGGNQQDQLAGGGVDQLQANSESQEQKLRAQREQEEHARIEREEQELRAKREQEEELRAKREKEEREVYNSAATIQKFIRGMNSKILLESVKAEKQERLAQEAIEAERQRLEEIARVQKEEQDRLRIEKAEEVINYVTDCIKKRFSHIWTDQKYIDLIRKELNDPNSIDEKSNIQTFISKEWNSIVSNKISSKETLERFMRLEVYLREYDRSKENRWIDDIKVNGEDKYPLYLFHALAKESPIISRKFDSSSLGDNLLPIIVANKNIWLEIPNNEIFKILVSHICPNYYEEDPIAIDSLEFKEVGNLFLGAFDNGFTSFSEKCASRFIEIIPQDDPNRINLMAMVQVLVNKDLQPDCKLKKAALEFCKEYLKNSDQVIYVRIENSGNSGVEDSDIKALGKYADSIQYLSIVGSSRVTREGVDSIKNLKNLEGLILSHLNYDLDERDRNDWRQKNYGHPDPWSLLALDKILPELNLKHLYISNCRSTGEVFDIECLTQIKTLTDLSLYNVSIYSNYNIFNKFSCLKSLTLGDCNRTNSHFNLREPWYQEFNFEYFHLKEISKIGSITELNLFSCERLGFTDLNPLLEMPLLSKIILPASISHTNKNEFLTNYEKKHGRKVVIS